MAEAHVNSRVTQNSNNNNSNPIDSVVASQSELGPTPPDGGYGWAILLGAFVFQLTVPTLVVFYGIILLYMNSLDDYEADSSFRLWDSSIGLIPVLFIVIKLLLEPWSRSLVSIANMPRIMAITGVCLIGAGVMLSSFSDEEVIINIFSGLFTGMGAALTSQQSEVLLGHYFRNKLDTVKTFYRLAPSFGYSIVPFAAIALCSKLGTSSAILIYGAVIIQNCLFLAAYTRPIYITQPIKRNYKMLNDAEEDEDEEIFSNNNAVESNTNITQNDAINVHVMEVNSQVNDEADEQVIATLNTQNTTREVVQVNEVQLRSKYESPNENRFSSEFIAANRFSSDFRDYNGSQNRPPRFENSLETIERYNDVPQTLYRETTLVNEARNDSIFSFDSAEVRPGTARRNKNYKRNFISIMQMFLSLDFYLYTLLQTNVTLSLFIFGLLYGPYVSQQEPTMTVTKVATLVGVNYVGALCLNVLSVWLPKSITKRSALCSLFCTMAAIGFYGISVSGSRSWLVVWGMIASYATTTLNILQQPVYEERMSEFDTLATSIASNFATATIFLVIVFVYSYEYATCFEVAALLQIITSSVFFSTVISKNYMRRR